MAKRKKQDGNSGDNEGQRTNSVSLVAPISYEAVMTYLYVSMKGGDNNG